MSDAIHKNVKEQVGGDKSSIKHIQQQSLMR